VYAMVTRDALNMKNMVCTMNSIWK
jgi:hypothetical protein